MGLHDASSGACGELCLRERNCLLAQNYELRTLFFLSFVDV